MDWHDDGHLWIIMKMSNIKNDHIIIFCYAIGIGHLVRPNNFCTYLKSVQLTKIDAWGG